MKALLFDTQGSISRAEYFTGCIVLLIAQYCLHMGGLALMVLSLLPQAVSSLILSFAMMLLAYPYFCLYGKRLESLSYSRWWFAPILVVFYASLMVFGYLSGEVSEARSSD